MNDELSYEEALIAAVLWHFDERGADQHKYYQDARDAIRLSSPLVRATLARGPWKAGRNAAEEVGGDRDEWRTRAIAAEARVRELEAKLADAALVEAGWVPHFVATKPHTDSGYGQSAANQIVAADCAAWLSRRAASAKADGGGK